MKFRKTYELCAQPTNAFVCIHKFVIIISNTVRLTEKVS